jgi:two-component sensor histidine kinase
MSDPADDSAERTTRESLEAELERERARAREIDHRAKNSLQLAGSLALLTARRTTSPEAQAALKALHHRIAAIGAVHRGFLDSPRPGRFDLTAFLREHLPSLVRMGPPDAGLSLDLEPVEIASSVAAPLALIVGELVGNALVHAGPAPQVTVSLTRRGEGFRLAVTDRGPGLADPEAAAGFGLTIVRLMTLQLRADLIFEDAQPGLRAVVTLG